MHFVIVRCDMFGMELICRHTQHQNQSKHIIKSLRSNVYVCNAFQHSPEIGWVAAPCKHDHMHIGETIIAS